MFRAENDKKMTPKTNTHCIVLWLSLKDKIHRKVLHLFQTPALQKMYLGFILWLVADKKETKETIPVKPTFLKGCILKGVYL